MSKRRRPPKFVFALLIIVAIFAMGALVMVLWNAILPDVLNTNTIGYWQALGLLLLCKILFSSFGPRRGPGPRFGPPGYLMEKLKNMTPEERAQFRANWSGRCGNGRSYSPNTVVTDSPADLQAGKDATT